MAGLPARTKGILLNQLKETQEEMQWFVPLHAAIKDLTPAQAMWQPNDSSHSIVQLVSRLIFWNLQSLNTFKGMPGETADINNNMTFANIPSGKWNAMVSRMDSISKAWEETVSSTDRMTGKSYALIGQVSTHNAYHTGQIMHIRKQEHAWDSSKGVK